MKYKPHEYQEAAKDFIIEHGPDTKFKGGCGLLLDLGLGKTVICLTAIWELIFDYFEIDKVLVIAPLRVAKETWPAEILKFDHLEGLTYSLVLGTEKQRVAALKKTAHLYIINRENVPWLVKSGLFDFTGSCIVCDELSSFKSSKAQRFRSLRKVRASVSRFIGLTATPAANGLEDLWAQINLIDLGERLGRTITGYRERYFVPDKRNREVVFSYKPKEGAEEAIYKAISDICISMKGSDYLKLPEKVVTDVVVEMSPAEKEKYEMLKRDLVLSLPEGDIDAKSAVGLSNKLLQMASGVVYDENGKVQEIHEQKLEELESIIEQANGKPVLVCYWFKAQKERLIKRFGAVPIETSESIASWCKKEIPVACIQPMSCSYGLNLQSGGSHLVWLDLTWSLELYQQMNGRLYRQGAEETVTIQHIVMKDTIDEDVLLALSRKDVTQETLLNAVKARIGGQDESRRDV